RVAPKTVDSISWWLLEHATGILVDSAGKSGRKNARRREAHAAPIGGDDGDSSRKPAPRDDIAKGSGKFSPQHNGSSRSVAHLGNAGSVDGRPSPTLHLCGDRTNTSAFWQQAIGEGGTPPS